MENKQAVTEAEWASEWEVKNAMDALTDEDMKGLYIVARSFVNKFLVWKFGGVYEAEDLFHCALERTLNVTASDGVKKGVRRWNKSTVNFFEHLCGAMKSIASHMLEEKIIETQLSRENSDKNVTDAVDRKHVKEIREKEQSAGKKLFENLKEHFNNKPLTLGVIEAMECNYDGPDTKELLGITQTQYETECRSINRALLKYGKAWV